MKRITITLDEDLYVRLIEYSLVRSKAELRNVSMSEAIRELLLRQVPSPANTQTTEAQTVLSR